MNNTPGIDTTIEYDIPESEGGGSLKTSFRYDDTIFIPISPSVSEGVKRRDISDAQVS